MSSWFHWFIVLGNYWKSVNRNYTTQLLLWAMDLLAAGSVLTPPTTTCPLSYTGPGPCNMLYILLVNEPCDGLKMARYSLLFLSLSSYISRRCDYSTNRIWWKCHCANFLKILAVSTSCPSEHSFRKPCHLSLTTLRLPCWRSQLAVPGEFNLLSIPAMGRHVSEDSVLLTGYHLEQKNHLAGLCQDSLTHRIMGYNKTVVILSL